MPTIWRTLSGVRLLVCRSGYVDPVAGSTGKIPGGFMGDGGVVQRGWVDCFWGYDCERYLQDAVEGGKRKPRSYLEVLKLAEEGSA